MTRVLAFIRTALTLRPSCDAVVFHLAVTSCPTFHLMEKQEQKIVLTALAKQA